MTAILLKEKEFKTKQFSHQARAQRTESVALSSRPALWIFTKLEFCSVNYHLMQLDKALQIKIIMIFHYIWWIFFMNFPALSIIHKPHCEKCLHFEEYAYRSFFLFPFFSPLVFWPQKTHEYTKAIWSTMPSRHKNRLHHVLTWNTQDFKAFWNCY